MEILDIKQLEIPTEPIVMAQEEHKIKSFQQNANQLAGLLNNVLEAYRALDLGELTYTELSSLIQKNNAEDLVRDRVSGNQPRKIGGLIFAADKVKEMVEIPDLSELNSAISTFKTFFDIVKNQSRADISLKHFEISEGEVIVTEAAIQHNISFYTTYAASQGEKETWLILQEMARMADYLREKHGVAVLMNKVIEQQSGFTLINNENKQVIKAKINPHGIKRAFSNYSY